MPLSGPQQPGFFLPAAEYLNLAPNTHIALQGRRRAIFGSPVTVVAASGTNTANGFLAIEFGFVNGSGIYLHTMDGIYVPADASGELQITNVRMGFSIQAAGDIDYDMGIASALLSTPLSNQTIITDREKLVLQRDCAAFGTATQPPTLFVAINASVHNNDTTNPHSYSVAIKMVWTRIDGVQE